LKEVLSFDLSSAAEWEEIVKEVDCDGDGRVLIKIFLHIFRFHLKNSSR